MIGDTDPEDTYDATDPIPERLDVLERTVDDLVAARDDVRRDLRRLDALRLVANLGILTDTLLARRLARIRSALEDL